MHQLKTACHAIKSRFLRAFPERAIEFHTHGGSHRLHLSSKAQALAGAGALGLAMWLALGTTAVVGSATVIAEAHVEVAQKDAQVAAMAADLDGLKQQVAATAARLEQRQKVLNDVLSGSADIMQLAAVEATPPVHDHASHALLAPLRELEARQSLIAEKATVAAEARFRDTRALIRSLGLDPSRFTRQSMIAVGGPMVDAAGQGGPLAKADPKFKELFLSWKRLDLLEKALSVVPSFKPVKNYTYTSGYGIRFDPFTGSTAMHAGVDMSGPVGEPIYAAADGVVAVAGWQGAYGKMVELTHGQGIDTRYAHMSSVAVRPGATVKKGDLIGRMGSTGRSTGSHLHYEVRIDGRSVNPMPFLEAGAELASIQDRAGAAKGGPLTHN